MRILDAAHVDHVIHSVDATGEDTGVDIAHRAGEDPDHVFKTLVTQGKSGEHLVFMIPVACELDLRKAARAAGEKSVAMVRSRELFELTGANRDELRRPCEHHRNRGGRSGRLTWLILSGSI